MDELKCLAADLQPDVICISETWTHADHTKAFLTIDNYGPPVGRRDRADTGAGRGGGVLIWVRCDISAPESERPEFRQFKQCCCVKLPIRNGQELELVLVYRPHRLYGDDEVNANNALLGSLFQSVQKPAVFLGDFNCSDIDWETATSGSVGSFLLHAASENFYTQHVDFATLPDAQTMPDLVFSSDQNLILDVLKLSPLGKSDHVMMLVTGPLGAPLRASRFPTGRRLIWKG